MSCAYVSFLVSYADTAPRTLYLVKRKEGDQFLSYNHLSQQKIVYLLLLDVLFFFTLHGGVYIFKHLKQQWTLDD